MTMERLGGKKTSHLLSAAACLALLAPGSIAQAGGQPQAAQAPEAKGVRTQAQVPDPSPLSFEVATIRTAAPSPDGHTHINYPSGDRFSAINITLLALMQWAYSMPENQILNGPPWLASSRFDIQANYNPEAARASGLSPTRDLDSRMVQALLADRCSLKLHSETRILPAYDLVLAKGGSKLQPAKSGMRIGLGRTHLNGEGLTLPLIAEQLSQITGRVVVDKTGLAGRYDLHLEWAPDDAPPAENSAPSLFTAIQEQLGLKLEPAREPVPVLVIDHIETPSAN